MPPKIRRLQRRHEFLAVARTGRRWVTPAFVVQAGPRPGDAAAGEIGIGFTASKRVGSAVRRNRAKRRLREAVRLVLPDPAQSGWNYVIVARASVVTWPFETILDDMRRAFERAPSRRAKPRRGSPDVPSAS